MDPAGLDALADAIRHMHGCEPTWATYHLVAEKFNGEIVWQGEVQEFDLVGHPKATKAYAWSYATEGAKRKFVAVLQLGPVVDAVTAVRASIAARGKS